MSHARPLIAVFGSSTIAESDPSWRLAYELGRELGAAGADVMTGGYGRDEVRQFYATWFIGHWPADVQITKRADPSRYTEPENALEAPLSRPRRSSRSS